MDNQKETLRQEFKAKRMAMSPDDVKARSRAIASKLLTAVDWSKIKTVHIYKAMPELKEVDTVEIVRAIYKKWPDIKISVAGLAKDEALPAGEYDLVIVPLLAFDKANYRLGWGGGWYDRFLATQPQAVKIGLCFQNGFADKSLPHEPHDIPLDKVITEI